MCEPCLLFILDLALVGPAFFTVTVLVGITEEFTLDFLHHHTNLASKSKRWSGMNFLLVTFTVTGGSLLQGRLS